MRSLNLMQLAAKVRTWQIATRVAPLVAKTGLLLIPLFMAVLWLLLTPIPVHADDPTFTDSGQTLGTHFSENFSQAVAVGDLDGDGDLDAFVGNFVSPNRVWLNDSGGIFTDSGQALGTSASYAVALGDLDGDGDLDAFVGNGNPYSQGAQPNRVWLNDSGGIFTDSGQILGNSSSQAVALGDLDGDGDLDAFVGNDRDEPNRVWLNDGGGIFTDSGQILGNSSSQAVALGDLDGDGDLDAFIGNYVQPNRVWLNNGGGTFTDSGQALDNSPSEAVALGDLDGDGDLDAFVGNFAWPNQVWLNNGGGTFTDSGQAMGDTSSRSLAVALGDLDGDGDLDAFVGNNGQNGVWLNNGGGMFTDSGQELGHSWSAATALGDLDGDGDLDAFIGNTYGEPNRVWLSNGGGAFTDSGQTLGDSYSAAVALGDLDSDGDLDTFVGSNGSPNRVWLNNSDGTFTDSGQTLGGDLASYAVALGDLDGDDDLDAFVGNEDQPNRIWLNDGGVQGGTPGSFSDSGQALGGVLTSYAVALGDLDNDGDLDAFVGNYWISEINQVWLNDGGGTFTDSGQTLGAYSNAAAVALGDLDGDGDLDAYVGNDWGQPNRVWLNNGGGTFTDSGQTLGESDSRAVALGDLDGDGDLDVFVGNNFGQPNRVWLNNGDGIFTDSGQTLGDLDSRAVALGDLDGDGDLDAFVGNHDQPNHVWQPNRVWLNDGDGMFTDSGQDLGHLSSQAVALGDLDGNGNLDAFVGNYYDANRVYLSKVGGPIRFRTAVNRPGPTQNAGFYSTPILLDTQHIPLTYALFDPEGDPMDRVEAFYSPGGGGRWLEAVPAAGTVTTNLATSPFPTPTLTNTYVFTWDVFTSDFFGQSDNVVIRLVAYPGLVSPVITGTYRYTNAVAGPYMWPNDSATATTFPFRVRGTQVQVISGTQGISNAVVYRLPAGDQTGGFLIGSATEPFVTDANGYLQGRGQIGLGDRLLALVPVPLSLTDTQRFSTTLSLYYTNIATVTETGLQTLISNTTSLTVSQPGVQQLQVSAQRPLLLFDLDISLEWDASHDSTYLDQLEFDLKRTSQHLFDFTDGQVALGDIWVYQDADRWSFSHINVHATNRLRPYATIGGAVLTDTLHVIPELSHIGYGMGQVHMGSTWNRYGNPAQSIGVDWPVILAHELGHYLLFLEDTYLGLEEFDGAEVLTSVDSCIGSAMGDVYNINNTEFVFDDTQWNDNGLPVDDPNYDPNCAETLAEQELERDEWEIIRSWYPWLHEPTAVIAGPSIMPYNLTTVSIFDPLTRTNALEDPTFYLDYAGGVVGTSEARAFLLRNADDTSTGTDQYEYVYDLGNPVGGQNRVLARGAQPGDRLCVFDQARNQYGCEIISFGDERLALKKDETWQPVIQISPVNSTTFDIEVEGLPGGLTNLKARLYPEYGEAFAIVGPLLESNGMYIGTLNLDYATLSGNLQLWADNPRRETIVTYRIGGNPGSARGGGGSARGGGGSARGGGGSARGGGGSARGGGGSARGGGGSARGGGGLVQGEGGAPAVSPDGQMTYFDRNFDLAEGQFYTVQDMAGLPELPTGKVAIGRGYNLFATGFVTTTNPLTGSVSFQYLGNDVLTEEKSESELGIHFWDGSRWLALKTNVDQTYNLASAASEGPGVYALLAGTTTPQIVSVTPAITTNAMTSTLVISGGYYLEPLLVTLEGPTATYKLPVQTVSPVSVTAQVTQGLQAREYAVYVSNTNQPGGSGVSNPGSFALFDPATACFYDFFESGASQWQTSGDWGIVILPNGQRAMTDSPLGTYGNAITPTLTLTTAVTSAAFSLNDCSNPALTFRHDHAIIQEGNSQDVGRVEISTDDGATWTELSRYADSLLGLETQDVASPEWTAIDWQDEQLSLSAYTGTVRLRFSLAVDQVGADKGWVFDDVLVQSGPPPGSGELFLPIIMKEEGD